MKLMASIKKELLLLFSDKVGLSIMFLMPLLLVFIITIIQDSAYKLINENKVSLIIANQDKGEEGFKLIQLLTESGLFEMQEQNHLSSLELKDYLLDENKLTALYIPESFSDKLKEKAIQISGTLTSELGLSEINNNNLDIKLPDLHFYHDPVLQENYSSSIANVIGSFLNLIENELMMKSIYAEVGIEKSPARFMEKIIGNKIVIDQMPAKNDDHMINPNSTQHNVPAWTIFAMFFMVVSLGSNIVKERINGSFLRLKTMPTNYIHLLSAKMIVYILVAVLQFALIFSIGIIVFPLINLPKLILPSAFFAFIAMMLISSLAAVSYAITIGALSKTQEQSNGIGAISVIIFAALGGIWVPTFVMPEYLKVISNFSPMHWCLEGFYILFLKGGSWSQLFPVIGFLVIFIAVCQIITYTKLKLEKLI